MKKPINRRQFFKKSLITSAAVTSASGFPRAASSVAATRKTDVQDWEESVSTFPTGKIGNVQISRLIIGGNQFSGWSHSRDLSYLRDLFLAYSTEQKIMETLEKCEQEGINTIITASSGYLSKFWNQMGGKMQWIAQVHPKTNDLTSNIKQAIDNGAIGAYIQGGIGDSFVKNSRVDLLGKAVEFIKSNGLIAGIGGHSVEVPVAIEKAGINVDFYMKTLHHGNYWSATPKDSRVEFNVDSGSPYDHDNIWSISPERTIEFMKTVERPWIAFKVLAAGAIHPSEGFEYAFANGADFICVGMFDFQITENALIARDKITANSNRKRPWKA
jgi:hypothetical protein